MSSAADKPGPQLEVMKNGFGANITNLNFADGVDEDGFRFIEQGVKKVFVVEGSLKQRWQALY